jgi:hypothetical protein
MTEAKTSEPMLDRAEYVMVDVRFWHIADIDFDIENVRF